MLAKSLPVLSTMLLSVACNEVVTIAPPDALEDDVDAAIAVDAEAEPCDLTMPFGELELLGGINGSNPIDHEEFASLSPDELTIYFASDRPAPGTAAFDIFVASRSSRDEAFGAPISLAVLNSAGDDRSPSISADGLELYFHSSRTGTYEIYVSTRANTAAAFTAPGLLGADVNTAAIETSPTVVAGGDALYFEREAVGGGSQVWRATRGPTGFGSSTLVASLSTPSSFWSAPSEDELTIYFASDRPGGSGMVDIWNATRATTSAAFGAITNVAELNTGMSEGIDWVSPDGCRAYVSSGISGSFHIYRASRPE